MTRPEETPSYLRSISIFLIIKGIFCFLASIILEYNYAQSGRIDNFAKYFLITIIAYPFSIIIGLYFNGIYLGSDRQKFLNKLSTTNGPINQKKEEKPKLTFPIKHPIPLRRAFILISIDLILCLSVLFFIPALPHFYIVHIAEVVCLFLILRDIIANRNK